MSNMPFEMTDREIVDGGIRLVFRCARCEGETSLFIRDDDPLQGKYPLSCSCGVQVNMFFGSPKVGKALIKAMGPAPEPRRVNCPAPSLN